MNWLKKTLGIKKTKPIQEEIEFGENDAYFHEDFYCQVELLPQENLDYLHAENQKIKGFAEEHSNGIGYTDVHIRNENRIQTIDRAIPRSEFDAFLLSLGFTKMQTVYSGYGSSVEKCANVNAYSIDKAIIFCDYQESFIKNIWIDGFRLRKDSPFNEEMVVGLYSIGQKWNLILNDWDLAEIIDLSDTLQIKAYTTQK